MRTLYGKQVLEALSEVVDPKRAAVLVVDMHELEHNDVSCLCANRDSALVRRMIPRLGKFLDGAREAGATIAWVQHTTGVWGSQGNVLKLDLPTTLQPLEGEIVVKKTRSSAFMGTGLDVILRNIGVRTAIVTGIATEGCIDATALDAGHLDFYAVVIEDCVASFNDDLHTSALAVLRYRCDCVTSGEVLAEWRRR